VIPALRIPNRRYALGRKAYASQLARSGDCLYLLFTAVGLTPPVSATEPLEWKNALSAGTGVICAQNCAGSERKAHTRKAAIPDRPTKPIFIALLQSEFIPFDPGSLVVPWAIKMLRLADKPLFINSL
jgi:hypothetical protein